MKHFLLALILIHSLFAISQQKTLDVDILYNKYKDKKEIIIYTAQENITANVEIKYNDLRKPYAVVLYGNFSSGSAIDGVIENLVKQKEKAGYVFSGPDYVSFYDDRYSSVSVMIYQKGTQYAKYGRSEIGLGTIGDSVVLNRQLFYFEVGAVSRKTSGKTEPFRF